MTIRYPFYLVKIFAVWVFLSPCLSIALNVSEEGFVIESDRFGNRVCFVNLDVVSSLVEHDTLKQSCCSVLFKLFEHGHWEEERFDSLFDLCVEEITKVPTIEVHDGYNADGYEYIPIYYLYKVINGGRIQRNNSKLNSPFHHSSMMEMIDDTEENHAVEYQIEHSTELSEEGGMHRAFMNKVRITSVDPNQDYTKGSLISKDVETVTIKGNMTFLFPILEGYFIDLDDPFQDDIDQACHLQNSLSILDCCQVEIVTTPSDLVIDIEQPSFASKQHVIAFSLHFQASIMNDVASYDTDPLIELTFVPMIHLRYQTPIYGKGLITTPVSNLFFHHAYIETKIKHSNDDNDITYNTDLKVARQLKKLNNSRIFSVEVAPGLDSHHDIVMVFTMVACVFGAIQMIRDFSKIGRWY